ncbi:hypothetical protein JCM19046_3710 [Bacillus sp. JCM 19046]|uniref:Uncharacterized protein n=1 Tax=Shouchella xiaoxiensis TaxID=766895 RepID=A0ABS2SV31_9BACI|nr:hypothetical protein [Shouchella xiaoxiensis]MBM7839389.1 hypothetical protein [Shouchella xiaoxiensis]GAF12482.1 hypothetical protein JCM19045_1681 [Bacillus sp. JCM 19045]GAF19084.1 hypothetical protein JCM19046_3710 [Bacillus sp. JCM 19046]
MAQRFKRTRSAIVYGFALIGFVASTLFIGGLVADIRAFDETSGGYEPPYEGVTGDPINFDELDQTNEGIVGRGYSIDILLNCTTGMISFEFFKQRIDFRVASGRALAVHKPQEACEKRGFEPAFGH